MSSRIPYSDGAVQAAVLEINDIVSNTATEGDVLQYSADGEWVASQVQSSYGLEVLNDVQIDRQSLQTGQGLTWDSVIGKFVNNSVVNGQSTVLAGLDDVDSNTAPLDGQILVYSSGSWRPGVVQADGSIAIGVSVNARKDSVVISNISTYAGERCVCFGSVNARAGTVEKDDMTLLGVAAGRNNAEEGITAVGVVSCLSASKPHATAVGGQSARNGCGTQSCALGYFAGDVSGDYSVSIGPQCTAKGARSIALSAHDTAYAPTGTNSFYVNPNNVNTSSGLGQIDSFLMYDGNTGRVFRQRGSLLTYTGSYTNNTGVTCVRESEGVYVLDYSQHANSSLVGEYPIIQVGLFTREEDNVPNNLIYSASVSNRHFVSQKQIRVYVGAGVNFSDFFHFSLVCSRNPQTPFFVVYAGGLPGSNNSVVRRIESYVYG